jgi:hypothetical protein
MNTMNVSGIKEIYTFMYAIDNYEDIYAWWYVDF